MKKEQTRPPLEYQLSIHKAFRISTKLNKEIREISKKLKISEGEYIRKALNHYKEVVQRH